ncbi:MAG: hypothetical protein JSU04_19545 [Bdellovibrionales bacterium]|nr:hypothetical protein [Bdellovibrionales bacterium]
MKKLILGACLLISMNALALDLSNDQVANPVQDATNITASIGARGAILLSSVTCRQSGTADHFFLTCSVQRRLTYQDGNIKDEGFGCMMEYSLNKSGQDYTRDTWECPIL